MINSAIIRGAALLLLLFVFFLTAFFGVRAGVRQANSRAVIANAQELQKSLQYFHQDNNRYPTVAEFASSTVMGTYLNPFPAHEFNSGNCSKSFAYRSPNKQQYELQFCLPRAEDGIPEGWHPLSE